MKRYNESAQIEVDILLDIAKKGGVDFNIVHLVECFWHEDKEGKHMCLVFETLGQSLYDFIKANKYKGMLNNPYFYVETRSCKKLVNLNIIL